MNIALPEPMRDDVQERIDSGQYAGASDYVRDLIRRDRCRIHDEQHWLRNLDASIVEGIAEMEAGDAILADLEMTGGASRT